MARWARPQSKAYSAIGTTRFLYAGHTRHASSAHKNQFSHRPAVPRLELAEVEAWLGESTRRRTAIPIERPATGRLHAVSECLHVSAGHIVNGDLRLARLRERERDRHVSARRIRRNLDRRQSGRARWWDPDDRRTLLIGRHSPAERPEIIRNAVPAEHEHAVADGIVYGRMARRPVRRCPAWLE